MRSVARSMFAAVLCALAAVQGSYAASVIGVVTESSQATIDGAPALRGQTVMAGARVQVADGAAIVMLSGTTRLILRHDTEVSLDRAKDGGALALLVHGDLSFTHGGSDPDIRVRTGNITIRPAGRERTLGIVAIKNGGLQIAATSGLVRVEGAGEPVEVSQGKAVEFLPEGEAGGGSPSNSSAANSSNGPTWVRPFLCGLAGGAVGSIPVIVKSQQSASTDIGPYWTFIPAGIGGAELICYATRKPTAGCTLTATPAEVNLGDTVTLSWTSPPGYSDYLSDVGAEPSSGSVQVKPSRSGTNNWELTAKGGGGTLVCDARVQVKEQPDLCKLWYTTVDGKDFTIYWHLPKDATDGVLTDATRGTSEDLKGTDGKMEVTLATLSQYNLKYKIDGKPRVCNLRVEIPTCVISARKVAKGYELRWNRIGDFSSSSLDPKPTGTMYPNSANTNPTEDTTYTLTVKGKVYKDSSDPSVGTVPMESSCSVDVSPLSCTLEVDPTQITAPPKAKVTVTWDSKGTATTLTASSNNAPSPDLKPNPQQNPPTPQTLNIGQTTEFVLNVTGPGGEKASCRACVLNKPAAGKGKVLPIPPVFQKNPMWCWLTVMEMIFKYQTPPVPSYNPWKPAGLQPPQLVDPDKLYQWGILAISNPGCWLHPDACAMQGGSSWENIQRVLGIYPPAAGAQNTPKGKENPNKPVGSALKPGCLTKKEIMDEIDAGRPIVVGISPGKTPPPPTPQHVALIVGYQVNDAGDIDLIVNDPWPYHLLPQDPNPYVKAGGSKNCETNYSVDRQKFCAQASWNGSLVNIK